MKLFGPDAEAGEFDGVSSPACIDAIEYVHEMGRRRVPQRALEMIAMRELLQHDPDFAIDRAVPAVLQDLGEAFDGGRYDDPRVVGGQA